MNNHSWTQLKQDTPVQDIPDKFFNDAKWLDIKLQSAPIDQEKGPIQLLELNEELTTLIQNLQKNLRKVRKQAEDYDNAAKKVYKLIDVNLRFYRFSEIDKNFKEIDNPRKDPSKFQLKKYKSGMQSMLNTIYDSIRYANNQFEPKEEFSDEVVYLFDLAYHFETSIRYFAKYSQEKEDDAENDFDIIEEFQEEDDDAELEEQLINFNNQEDASFVQQSEKEMEEILKG